MDNNVSVVISNYNGLSLLEENIPYVIDAFNNKTNQISEIIVVDDASGDKSVSFIKKYYPQIKVIRHTINRGFPAAVNTGVRMAKGKFIVLLNNDVAPKSDFLVSSIPLFKDEKVFAISFHEKGYGFAVGKFENGYIIHEGKSERDGIYNTFWASGGSSIVRRDIWIKLGGFDEKLYSPYYWEDIDISYRARKRGYKILWNSHSRVTHEHESTTGKIAKRKRSKIQERNQLLFIWKNLTSKFLFRKHITGLGKRLIRHPGYFIIYMMAFTKLRQVLKARHKEMRESKISDEAIFAEFTT